MELKRRVRWIWKKFRISYGESVVESRKTIPLSETCTANYGKTPEASFYTRLKKRGSQFSIRVAASIAERTFP